MCVVVLLCSLRMNRVKSNSLYRWKELFRRGIGERRLLNTTPLKQLQRTTTWLSISETADRAKFHPTPPSLIGPSHTPPAESISRLTFHRWSFRRRKIDRQAYLSPQHPKSARGKGDLCLASPPTQLA